MHTVVKEITYAPVLHEYTSICDKTPLKINLDTCVYVQKKIYQAGIYVNTNSHLHNH